MNSCSSPGTYGNTAGSRVPHSSFARSRRPNDEASNLLLAATYVMTGRTYAGYVILTRLKAAGYETATTDVYLKQAEAALKN